VCWCLAKARKQRSRTLEPDVLVIDEIATAEEVAAVASAIARGVAVLCGVASDGLTAIVRDEELRAIVGLDAGDDARGATGVRAGDAQTRARKPNRRGSKSAHVSSKESDKLALFARLIECRSVNNVVIHQDVRRNTELYLRLGVLELEQRRVVVHDAASAKATVWSRFNFDLQRSLEHDALDLDPRLSLDYVRELKRCTVPQASLSFLLFEQLANERRSAVPEAATLEELRAAVPARDFYKEQLTRRPAAAMPSGYNPLRWGEVGGMKPNERPATILRRLIDLNQLDTVLGPRSARLARLKELGEVDADGRPTGPEESVGSLSLDFPGSERALAAEKARREAEQRPEAVTERRATLAGLDREARILGASAALRAFHGEEDEEELDENGEPIKRDLGDLDAFDVDEMRQRYFDSWAERLKLSEEQLREKLELILQQSVDPTMGDPAAELELKPMRASSAAAAAVASRQRTPLPAVEVATRFRWQRSSASFFKVKIRTLRRLSFRRSLTSC